MDSPVKKIAVVIAVIVVVGLAVYSAMKLSAGPQGHINLTPEQMIQMDKNRNNHK